MPRGPLAVSMGEPAGIGPELILSAWLSRTRDGLPPFAVVADPDLLAARARLLGLDVPLAALADAGDAAERFSECLPVLPVGGHAAGEPGRPHPDDAPLVIGAVRTAVELVRSGTCSAVVTAPIAKAPLLAAGFPHPGHTEFLGELAQDLWNCRVAPVMLLWSDKLAVVPVTVHVPLARVPGLLSTDLIVATAITVAAELRSRFGIAGPRLALAGLNPHAGEGGAIGTEDEAIIVPAVAALRGYGIDATGPHPADTLFHAAARTRYDVALAMYHDQALIPIKTLAFDSGVNVTLGLPFVRTSPDHGTAFDIAGTGKASPRSFVGALRLAATLAGTAREPVAA